MWLMLLTYGCGGSKPRFTDEELKHIPLAQKDGLPEASGGFVLAVGDETVTSDEIITEPLLDHFRPIAQKSSFEQFKKQAGPELEQLISTRVSNILLYQQAKREMGAGVDIDDALEKATESEVRRFVAGFNGDYARAEQALKQMGMDWHSFREYQKKMILSQEYVRQQLPEHKPITHSELVSCYNEIKEEFFAMPATITFRLIDIQIPKVEPASPNISRPEQARKLAAELKERLDKGEDFAELARQYSHGHTASSGGLWQPVQPQSIAKPYDVLAVEAEKIQPGQIAGPIEAGEHIFIMKLEEKSPKSFTPLENVQKEVEAKILFDRRKKTADEFGTNLVQQAKLNEMDAFIDFCLEKTYRICSR
ncbi:MAG: peptidylprolyl isomerase [Phycisphaerae bacterium]|nr:peptidylprolyl isomerase [Phycisphaerae bacterium]